MTDRGPAIQTWSGRSFYIFDPQPEDVLLDDIARALSLICRFNGHLRDNLPAYSVAQHAVLVSRWMEEDGYCAEWCLNALHHDSAEAYVGDLAHPIKQEFPKFSEIEELVMRAVAEAFNLTGGPDEIIKNYDRIALATERRDLMTRPWHEEIWRPYDLPKPRNEEITPWSHEIARERFLARHWELKQRIILEKARGVRIDD